MSENEKRSSFALEAQQDLKLHFGGLELSIQKGIESLLSKSKNEAMNDGL